MDQDPPTQAVSSHDRSCGECFPDIWIGAEPTFTLRSSQAPEWLSEALGEDKQRRAEYLTASLARLRPGALLLRTLGRQYSEEPRPRWSYGLYRLRDADVTWAGARDPLLSVEAGVGNADSDAPTRLRDALLGQLRASGLQCQAFTAMQALPQRLLAGADTVDTIGMESQPALHRPPLHHAPIPRIGLHDPMAAAGLRLFCLGEDDEARGSACLELPEFTEVAEFLAFLPLLQRACELAGIDSLVLRGYPPPVDARIAWTTVTPDPAVIEINQAPCASLSEFLAASRELHAAAEAVGLSACRLQYNGGSGDSGGGGQLTIGGRSPALSPFFRATHLLPELIIYLNNHPSLSYWFGTDYLGGSSQSPRPDEGVGEMFSELETALALFRRHPPEGPEQIWRCFAPFLADASGNAHRSELNIEKLWNPGLPGRGCLGLVEFRALRMSPDADHAVAVAALLRAVVAMLAAKGPSDRRLRHWGLELHDRFALPLFLRQDLREVLDDLHQAGLTLAPALATRLLQGAEGPDSGWMATLGPARIEIDKALEFWPLVGDVASQESGGSRTVDASTRRLQILLRGGDTLVTGGWQLTVQDHLLPLRPATEDGESVLVVGIRYRDYKPWRGLHPQVAAQNPIRIRLGHRDLDQVLEMELHNWQPQGQPYPDLPADPAEARRRRNERLLTRLRPADGAPCVELPFPASGYCVDLRRL